MTFTQDQLQKFVRFHEACKRAGGAPTLNREFADAANLDREDLKMCVGQRAELEAAAREAGLIA
jgi:hypothetical protein